MTEQFVGVDISGDGIQDIDLRTAGSSTTVGGVIIQDAANVGSGTGGYNTFLALGDNNDAGSAEAGLNTDDSNPFDPTNREIDASKTHTVLLAGIPVVVGTGTGVGGNGGTIGVFYYEIRLDLNESNNTPSTQISIDQFRLYANSSSTIENTAALGAAVYDMDATALGNISVLLSEAGSSGSGTDDYSFLVPVTLFGTADPATTYLYLFVELGAAGPNYIANGGFEEFNLQNAVTLNGTKFNDLDSDGIRDAGEVGVAGVTVFIDTDNDGVLDAGERSTVTGANGSYSFYGVAAGTYHIDEVIPAGSIQTTGEDEVVTVPTNITTGQIIVVDPIGNHYFLPSVAIDKVFVNVTDGPDAGSASTTVINGAGDIANYTIAVTNNGETALTGVTVTDALADGGVVTAVISGGFNTGDANLNNILDIGETWRFTASQTASQADLDTNGGGDSDKDNSATVVATQQGTSNTVTATDAAAAPIVPAAALAITKVFTGFTGGNTNSVGDFAGDVANYSITVTNTGNVTLTNVTVTDPLTNLNTNIGTLTPGQVYTLLSEQYSITQADLDGGGVAGGDHDIDNTATAVSDQTGQASASATAPLVYNPALNIVKTATPGQVADAAGELITYGITVQNTGNQTLTNIVVTDANADAGSILYVSGDTNSDGDLDVGETWTYSAAHTVTQAEIDSNGGGDGDLDNTAFADSTQTDPDSDDETVPVGQNPALNIVKDVTSVSGGVAGAANSAGDVINYSIAVENTGNITLTGLTVTDPNADAGSLQYVSGDTNADGELDVDEIWLYTATHTVTQTELNNRGGGDNDVDNIATADSNQTGEDTDDASAPLVYNPLVDLEKLVSTDGINFIDADTAAAGYQNVAVQSDVFFRVTVQNTGNIDLTNVVITDVNTTAGTPGASITLFSGGSLQFAGATMSGDTNSDGELDVGETWTINYTQGFDLGQHINTAYVTDLQGATDNDAAHYYGIQEGPGVRTPGFWSNLGAQFWDNIVGNETKSGPTFADGELVYAVDSNNDGVINGSDRVGLLIGDYNHNGLRDAGEDVLFISLADAKQVINASQRTVSGDGVQMLGRDVVATWLNYLAGNPIGSEADTNSPQHFINDAVDWLQTFAGVSGGTSNKTEVFDVYNPTHAAVRTNSSAWNTPQFAGDAHSASQMHSALDGYNNTGDINGITYAMSSHDANDVLLIIAANSGP